MRKSWSILWAARYIAKWEGWLPEPYLDTIASPAVWTQGYGHTGSGITFGKAWTKAYGLYILGKDCRFAAQEVDRVCKELKVKPTVRQRIAMISGVFNCGPGILSDDDIRKPLRRKNWKRVVREWADWSHADGVVITGLLRRRKSEGWLMLHSARPKRHPKPRVHPHTKAHKRR